MIRLSKQSDKDAMIAVAEASGLFETDQTDELAQMLDAHFSNEGDGGESSDVWVVDEDDSDNNNNRIVGLAYIAPERMTQGTWNLYLIAVHPDSQKQGRGTALLHYVENMLAKKGERILLVETSGLDDFAYVRAFYKKNGYDQEACIREFYTAGEDKIVFRKSLQ
jgi:ribosomal protein S18 acetylase RimI-like enzyme